MADRYRPQGGRDGGPPRMPRAAQDAMYHFKANQNEGRPSRPAERRLRPQRTGWRRPPLSERPLLTQKHNVFDLQTFRDPQALDKFRNPADLTDSEEDEMIESDAEENGMPPPKKTKTSDVDSPAPITLPKWSNPDPYTALPPPTETSGKSFDVVKLIRKAKISEAKNQEEQDLARNEDFISFDDGLGDSFPEAPAGPKVDRLGKRKRGQEEALPRPPGGYRPREDDSVLREWRALQSDESSPWHIPCRPKDTASIALHKEVLDFHEWVRPKEYDIEVRTDVINRLSLAFNRIESGEIKPFGSFAAGLYLPTGDMDLVFLQRSFRPGVFGANGLPEKPKRKLMEKFGKLLRDTQIALSGTVQLIPFAKVPIIKFVDNASRLKVDLSFNNDTGVTANETVQIWKSTYPAMPILVSIVKQFLMIRGLNDVSVGGLGGFSVICLVTSLVQHIPATGSTTNLGQLLVEFFNLYGNLIDKETVAIRLDPPGYIDKINYRPHLFNNDKRNRLTIIDPNRPENNVSGGSHLIEHIQDAFSHAHEILQEHLAAFSDGIVNKSSFSFLRDLVGGNFASYNGQRKALQDLYFGLTGREASEPPPRDTVSHREDPGYPGARREVGVSVNTNGQAQKKGPDSKMNRRTGSDEDGTGGLQHAQPQTPSARSERRAGRLKIARPDLASQIGSSISIKTAVELGGFENGVALDKYLTAAEAKERKSGSKRP